MNTETEIQIAAHAAGDALLAANPGASDRRPRRDRALRSIDDWEAHGLPAGAWKISKATVIRGMRRLVNLPQTLNQGSLDSCNFVCILYACLLRFPEETAAAARALYERGQAELGGLALRPNATLLATTEDAIVADDTAVRDTRRAAGKFVPLPLDPTDWMLQTALVDTILQKPGFTGLGASKDVMGLTLSTHWRDAIGRLSTFFKDVTLSTAGQIHPNFDTIFTDRLVKPNPQVELFVWLSANVFSYASFSLTGVHAVAVRGRAVGAKDKDVDLTIHSYGSFEVLTLSYSKLHSALQALIEVTIA